MLIIDAQVHIWGSGKPSDHHRQTSSYTAEELISEMDQAGVDGAVLHPPSWDAGSNEMAIEAVKRYPDRFCTPGMVSIGRSVATQADRDVEAADGDAGAAVVVDTAGSGDVARGRNDGLAVAGG